MGMMAVAISMGEGWPQANEFRLDPNQQVSIYTTLTWDADIYHSHSRVCFMTLHLISKSGGIRSNFKLTVHSQVTGVPEFIQVQSIRLAKVTCDRGNSVVSTDYDAIPPLKS